MLKPLMLGAAMMFAIPALAQTGSSNPDMSKPGSSTTSSGGDQANGTGAMNGGTSSASGTADSGWGTTGTTASGSMGNAGTTGTAAFTGRGGPYEGARNYPTCSRTLRDSCIQRGSRSSRGRR